MRRKKHGISSNLEVLVNENRVEVIERNRKVVETTTEVQIHIQECGVSLFPQDIEHLEINILQQKKGKRMLIIDNGATLHVTLRKSS